MEYETEPTRTTFPETLKDAGDLKQTITEGAEKMKDVATEHASQAKENLKTLAGHVQEEGTREMERVKGSLGELGTAAKHYFVRRPMLCTAVAFILGFYCGARRAT